jgi:membrane protein DedA with SNARE-associated domain
VLESLTDLVTSSPLTYGVLFLLVAGDAIVPLFPGESAVVAAAVLAADGGLIVWLVLAAAFTGALAGDLVTYSIGRVAGPRVLARFVRGEKGRGRVRWAERELERRGMALIAAAQFIPGGRNVVMASAGTLGFPLRRFLAAEAIGASAWAVFQTSLGYFGGKAFDSTLVAIGVSVGVAIALGGVVEAVDRLRRRRREPEREAGREPGPGMKSMESPNSCQR